MTKKTPNNHSTATSRTGGLAIVEDTRGRRALQLRSKLGMSREVFARLVPTSVRNLASLESGQPPSPVIQKNLTELQRVISALEDVVKQEAIGPWMDQPNAAFEGLKPIEVIERGEIDRIWRMLYQLQSGDAF
ncbi:hypothetical protein CA51_33970 [Rosistilla oblonga]|uniref:Uncharacterized protein n=3 Tax=Rosistilla TaxID=2795779 RepID=A0A518IYZ1_9BACT|nr:antitoxin Xre/MbcA/ParS toxin-binding domain-containing protein [Rosistilla oblonga]QDS89553.1 hypothetical protein EC9_37530 [Rosistilla ulvae]QDV13507.1 hypothetical protein CA51_33970 [Rosistilla oblonga]QDV58301.1 hypothetical protein Mal33_43190 [Rosistilla oblonga]